jgi:hypothetical protein
MKTRSRSSKSYNPQYKINLVKVFNRSYSSEAREVRDQLRASLSNPQFRSQFSKSVVDRIVERTLSGIDKNDAKFKEYSDSYVSSDIFKIYGKDPSEINLELSGEMLSSLRGIAKSQEIVIELIGKNNKAKAHGHVNGIKSKKYGKVKRDFLGLPDDDVDTIMIESIEAFRHQQFSDVANLFAGQDFAQQFGQVGSQPEFSSTISVQDVLAQIVRNLNDN